MAPFFAVWALDMHFGTAQRCPVLFIGILLGSTLPAVAFDDQDCAKIVATSQAATVEFSPGDTSETAQAKAIDEVSRRAVDEIIGHEIESARADVTEVSDDKASDKFKSAARSSYNGLVRVKIKDIHETNIDQRKLEIDADVSVCVPKPEKVVSLENEKAERDRQPPAKVDPDSVPWFNPTTGEAQLWYWQGPDQTYEFYDKGGFQPATGDPLAQVDRKFAKDWRALADKRRKEAEDRQAAQQKEQARQAAIEEANRQKAAALEEASAHATDDCDRTAANPSDPRKPSSLSGVRWDDLKLGAQAAIDSCTLAVQRTPSEQRYRYQLARAYSVQDPKRAMPIFKRLADENYPAAYDNYGWSLIDRRVGRNDLAGAVRAWQVGIQAGDPDAMTSMATFMLKGKVQQPNGSEAMLLLQRAARMGNQDAIEALQHLQEQAAQENAARVQQQQQAYQQQQLQQQQVYQQQQAARMFMGIMGGAIGTIGRR